MSKHRQTLQRMISLALIGIVVGLFSAFATIGFVELVQYLNKLLYVSASSRSELDGFSLGLTTVASILEPLSQAMTGPSCS